MTAQSREILLMNGRCHDLASLPLDPLLKARGIDMRALVSGYSTALYRGYQGCWELLDGQLYLIGVLDFDGKPFPLAQVFPGHPGGGLPLLADWFTGRLDLNEGERLAYQHMGWGGITARRHYLYLNHGRLVRQRRCAQAPRLQRWWARAERDEPGWQARVKAAEADGLGPLSWLEPAGRRALGLPPETADSDEVDDDYSAYYQACLQHCRRPPTH